LGGGFLLYFVLLLLLGVEEPCRIRSYFTFWLAILFSSINLHILDKEWLGQYGGGHRIGAANNETRNFNYQMNTFDMTLPIMISK
jgi:hypothetical protein